MTKTYTSAIRRRGVDYRLIPASDYLPLRADRLMRAHATFAIAEPHLWQAHRRLAGRSVFAAFTVFEGTVWPSRWLAQMTVPDVVVVPSRFCRETLIANGVHEGHVVYVPHCVDDNWLRPRLDQVQPAAIRHRLVILVIGTSAKRKGIDVALAAIAAAFDSRRAAARVSVVLRCDPDETRSYAVTGLAALVGRLVGLGIRVRWLRRPVPDSELKRIIDHADVTCLPSRAEGFGFCALESLARGTPVVYTDYGGSTDFLSPAVGWPVACRWTGVDGLFPERFEVVGGEVVEPEFDDVVELLRGIEKDRSDIVRRREACVPAAARFTASAVGPMMCEALTVARR